jgi:hypothetical protein
MLLLLFGASAAGKTTVVQRLRGGIRDLDVNDFDEVGVPQQPTIAWRYDANEWWARRAVEAEAADGTDVLVAGQTPPGEMLAAPSAPVLRIRACLLDCDDTTRLARLGERGDAWLRAAGGTLDDHMEWGRWMRAHAADRFHRLDVIRRDDSQRWEQLDTPAAAAVWPVTVVDTSRPVDRVVEDLERWIARERAARDAGPP